MICSPSCMFFPISNFNCGHSKNNNSNHNKNKKVVAKHFCFYNDKSINIYEKCNNFKPNTSVGTKGRIICFIGMSGCGKDTARKLAIDSGVSSVICYVTRNKRKKEVDGEDYYFITNKEFEQKIDKNEMAQYRVVKTKVQGQDKTLYYGVDKLGLQIPTDKVLVPDAQGFLDISKYYGGKNLIGVFVDCSKDIRKSRAKNRGDFTSKEWELREVTDSKTINLDFAKENCKYIIDNNGTEKLFRLKILEILKKEGMVN